MVEDLSSPRIVSAPSFKVCYSGGAEPKARRAWGSATLIYLYYFLFAAYISD